MISDFRDLFLQKRLHPMGSDSVEDLDIESLLAIRKSRNL